MEKPEADIRGVGTWPPSHAKGRGWLDKSVLVAKVEENKTEPYENYFKNIFALVYFDVT